MKEGSASLTEGQVWIMHKLQGAGAAGIARSRFSAIMPPRFAGARHADFEALHEAGLIVRHHAASDGGRPATVFRISYDASLKQWPAPPRLSSRKGRPVAPMTRIADALERIADAMEQREK